MLKVNKLYFNDQNKATRMEMQACCTLRLNFFIFVAFAAELLRWYFGDVSSIHDP